MTISTNRLFLGTVIVVVTLGGGAAGYQWHEKQVRTAYIEGFMDASKSAVKVMEDYQKSSDAAFDHLASECHAAIDDVGQAAARERALADLQPREPVEIVIRRKCGQFESPYMNNCVQ